jgi:hypothetical protein
MNPNEAEESFDRSVSMKRFRVTSESIMNSSFKTSARGTKRMNSALSPSRDGPNEERKTIEKRKIQ